MFTTSILCGRQRHKQSTRSDVGFQVLETNLSCFTKSKSKVPYSSNMSNNTFRVRNHLSDSSCLFRKSAHQFHTTQNVQNGERRNMILHPGQDRLYLCHCHNFSASLVTDIMGDCLAERLVRMVIR